MSGILTSSVLKRCVLKSTTQKMAFPRVTKPLHFGPVQSKGSLETVGFWLTFGYFCSATKVAPRRGGETAPDPAGSISLKR